MASRNKHKNHLWLGGIVGFLTGIGGNLIAAWIQQDLISNSFTPLRISLIFLCSLFGVILMIRFDNKKSTMTANGKHSRSSKNIYSKLRLAWSKFRTRGQGLQVEDVSAIGSDIDIDTK